MVKNGKHSLGDLLKAGCPSVEIISSNGNRNLLNTTLKVYSPGVVVTVLVDIAPDNDNSVVVFNDLCTLRERGLVIYPIPIVNAEYYYLSMVHAEFPHYDAGVSKWLELSGSVSTDLYTFEASFKRAIRDGVRKCMDSKYFSSDCLCDFCKHMDIKVSYSCKGGIYAKHWDIRPGILPSIRKLQERINHFNVLLASYNLVSTRLAALKNYRQSGVPEYVPDFIVDSCRGLSAPTVMEHYRCWLLG